MFPLARTRGHLWAHSPEPLRQPLLKCVHASAELRDLACQIFIDILPQPACPLPALAPQLLCEGHGPHGAQGRGNMPLVGPVQGQCVARVRVRDNRQPRRHVLLDSHTHPQVHG